MADWNLGSPPGGQPPPGGYGAPPGAPPGGYGPPGAPPGGYGPPGAPPPAGGYGAPVEGFGQPAPYGLVPVSPYAVPVQGSLGLGVLAGFFGGCIGFALVYALAKGPDTKKGASIGLGAGIALSLLVKLLLASVTP